MRERMTAVVVGISDCLAASLAAMYLNSGSDQPTKGFDLAATPVTIAPLVVAAAPALVLSFFRRVPRTALVFALGFLTGFVLPFVAAVTAFVFII